MYYLTVLFREPEAVRNFCGSVSCGYAAFLKTFFSGSILIPCFYLLDEEKSMIGAMISYPIGTCFVYIMMKFIENTVLAMTIGTVISIILFIVSWYFLSKYVENTDIK